MQRDDAQNRSSSLRLTLQARKTLGTVCRRNAHVICIIGLSLPDSDISHRAISLPPSPPSSLTVSPSPTTRGPRSYHALGTDQIRHPQQTFFHRYFTLRAGRVGTCRSRTRDMVRYPRRGNPFRNRSSHVGSDRIGIAEICNGTYAVMLLWTLVSKFEVTEINVE